VFNTIGEVFGGISDFFGLLTDIFIAGTVASYFSRGGLVG
jgi:hypothetical protein